MAITLGNFTFDAAHTTIRERYEEVGGRDARRIEIAGLVVGQHSVADIEAQLDMILAAASDATSDAELSVRSGRRILVRRSFRGRSLRKRWWDLLC